MVFGEEGWHPAAPVVRNLTPYQGYPLTHRIKVRFFGEPVALIAEGPPSGDDSERSGIILVRPGRGPFTVLRSLSRQPEL